MSTTLDYKIKVMQAFLNGEKIESRNPNMGNVWYTDSIPAWAWDYMEYRIFTKPREKTITIGDLTGDVAVWLRRLAVVKANNILCVNCYEQENGLFKVEITYRMPSVI